MDIKVMLYNLSMWKIWDNVKSSNLIKTSLGSTFPFHSF